MYSDIAGNQIQKSLIELENQLSELPRLSRWIGRIANQFSMSDEDLFRIDLVAHEMVSNIVNYAYGDNKRHVIRLEFRLTQRFVEIRLLDDGRPFNPFREPKKKLPESLAEAEIGGLGIHLVRAYTDEYRYERERGQNIVTLTFKR